MLNYLKGVAGLLAASFMTGLPAPAAAQDYPSKPIVLVVPFAPGGPTDLLARLAADGIRQNLGATVVVENKPGAGGSVAAKYTLAAGNDGYTLMFGTGGIFALNGLMYADPGYDPLGDFTPVAAVGSTPNLLVVNAELPVHTLAELVEHAKTAGGMSYGSGGFGTSPHLAAEMFLREAGITMKHIPYKGNAPAFADMAAGHIQMAFDSIGTALPQADGTLLRAIAVTTPERSPLAPDIPTIAESGFPGFDVTVYYGLFAPTGTPPEIVAQVNAAMNDYLSTPELQERYKVLGVDPMITTPEKFDEILIAEKDRWAPIIEAAGIRID